MLVLSRHPDEEIVVTLPDGREIVLKVVGLSGGRVHLGITADADITVLRREVLDRIQAAY